MDHSKRSINLIGLIIFVFCLAVGLAVFVVAGNVRDLMEIKGRIFYDGPFDFVYAVRWFVVSTAPIAVSTSLAVLALRLRRLPPVIRAIAEEPGIAAAGVVLVAVAQRLIGVAILGLRVGFNFSHMNIIVDYKDWFDTYFWGEMCDDIVFAVLVVFAFFCIRREWGPVRNGVDLLGRVVGFYWVLCTPFTLWFAYFCPN
jgi:hypothetical protein